MRLILSFILISSFLLVFHSNAQIRPGNRGGENADETITENEVDTLEIADYKPKVPKSFYIPTGVRVGADLIGLGINAFGGQRARYEFQADVDFHRIYLSGSFGTSNYTASGETFQYNHSGNFFRVGLSADFLKFDPDHNTFTVGLRYARANFSENLAIDAFDPIFGAYSERLENNSVQAYWFELTTGLRVEVFKNIYTGYTFRIQLSRQILNADVFTSYDVPGFGRAEFNNSWAFNYYLMYRIAWKEKNVMKRTR